ncbi:response regulator [Cohnella endophytica]|uniref:Response regulator n=1 Tax=Cohnella endophytica TaxID=2419778 RepID=A0A494Y4V3_9BACL|nr:response regulator [Cohnella endophytica]RKP57301.1 response regulator [Cohnella endophytica]
MKILLAEDEITIREGISAAIEWRDYGFELCGQAGDGLEALSLIDRFKPDIVITDIRMPRMTGLDLIESAKRTCPQLEFIILSGHNDFSYAKSALRFGVNDYLLKPCKPEELLDILLRTKRKIVKTRETEHTYNLSMAAVMEVSLGRWLRSPKQPLEKRADLLAGWNSDLRPTNLFVGVVRFDDQAIELIRYAAENIMQETLEEIYKTPVIVIRQALDFVWVANEPSSTRLNLSDNEAHRTKLLGLRDNLDKYLRVSASIGIGRLVDSVDLLHLSCEQATEALGARFYEGRGSIVFHAELSEGQLSYPKGLRDDHEMELLQDDILLNLRTLKFEEALDQTETWLELLRGNPHFGQSGANLKTTAFLLELQKLAQEQDAGAIEWKLRMIDWLQQLPTLETLEDVATLVKTLIRSLVAVLRSHAPIHRTVQAALDVIHSKYNTNIALDAVAKEVYVSNTYLSSLFKQELGVNFLDYLHQYRIEQAKPLLKRNYKIFAIAKMVGYHEERHFSATFKKWTGLTPTQFQKSH